MSDQSSADHVKATRLPVPVPITEQVWPEGTVPVVSIFCITYNHVNFIRDAIEGFLMQETTFAVEIFIHDDASTDGTAEIVKEYAEKYPKLFWTVLQAENQWSKGNPNKHFFELMHKQRGEFIAFCEGDDYWIAKEKLQKQVSLLDEQKEFIGCCHDVSTNYPNAIEGLLFNKYSAFADSKWIELKQLLASNWLPSCAVLIRKHSVFPLPEMLHGLAMGDWPMWIWASRLGKFLIDSQPLGYYRWHAGGVWSSLEEGKQFLEIIKMLSRSSHFLGKENELNGIEGILDYFCPIILRSFLGSETQAFNMARKYIKDSAWDQKRFLEKLAVRILDSQVIGEQSCNTQKITDSFKVCFYLKNSFKCCNKLSNIGSIKIAKSVVSQAWAIKLKRPFFATASLILAMLISLSGTFSALTKMVQISQINLRNTFGN